MSNVEILKSFFAAVESSDFEKLATLMDDKFTFVVGIDRLCLSKADFIAFYSHLKAAVPDFKYNPT